MSDRTARDWYEEGQKLRLALRDEEALAAYEQSLSLVPSNMVAYLVLKQRQRLHHPQVPAGRLSYNLMDNDLNGTRHGSDGWRTPASFEGAVLEGQQGTYQVYERLGGTLLTTSYLARDLAQDSPVVVKLLYPRVLYYLCLGAPWRLTLSNPHLERLLGYGVWESCCYLVTEYMEGQTLEALIADGAPFAVERALDIAAQIAQGLEALWLQGAADGDLSPAAILVAGDQSIKLTDIGLTYFSFLEWLHHPRPIVGPKPGRHLTHPYSGLPERELAYASPKRESAVAAVHGVRGDLYTLACILFEMLSGRLPYEATTPVDLVLSHLKSPIPSICALRPGLAPAFDAFFQRALAKNPDERDQTPEAFIQALESLEG